MGLKNQTGGTNARQIGFTPVIPTPVIPGLTIGIPAIKKNPFQVAGLTPLFPCTSDCREDILPGDLPTNLVFGNVINGNPVLTATYENDFTPLLIDVSAYNASPTTVTATWLLQKLNGDVWETAATLSSNNWGINYPLNSIKDHPTYSGYALNWGEVLDQYGVGYYRIKVNTGFAIYTGCLATHCFYLRQWTCEIAHGTTKMETWNTGSLGDPYSDTYVHNLCNISWYDSFRYRAFFGLRDTAEYKEVMLEWGKPFHGKIQRVRDEALPSYTWETNHHYQPYFDRFSVFAMMSDEMRVSDYNINNSDYSINRMLIVKDGGFSPAYQDQNWKRIAKVTVKFKRGVQSIIKSICCDLRPTQI